MEISLLAYLSLRERERERKGESFQLGNHQALSESLAVLLNFLVVVVVSERRLKLHL